MEIAPIGRVISNEGGCARIEILPEFQDGLYRIEESDELLVLYVFDRTDEVRLRVHPRGDPSAPEVGVFASRSPLRPNHIAATVVRLVAVSGGILTVEGLDALDGSPVVDIKPGKRRDDPCPGGPSRSLAGIR